MNLNLLKIRLWFILFCVGSVFNCFADTNLGNGVSYSGKVKNGQLTGKGDLTIRGSYGQVVVLLSGNFTTTENGNVQVVGDLYLFGDNQPTFQNANFEFSTQTPYSVCVKSGAKINTKSIELLTPDGSKNS